MRLDESYGGHIELWSRDSKQRVSELLLF